MNSVLAGFFYSGSLIIEWTKGSVAPSAIYQVIMILFFTSFTVADALGGSPDEGKANHSI
jgi:hypothetical protein